MDSVGEATIRLKWSLNHNNCTKNAVPDFSGSFQPTVILVPLLMMSKLYVFTYFTDAYYVQQTQLMSTPVG